MGSSLLGGVLPYCGRAGAGPVALAADPTLVATGGSQGSLGAFGGNLYVHLTAAIDVQWLNLTALLNASGVEYVDADPSGVLVRDAGVIAVLASDHSLAWINSHGGAADGWIPLSVVHTLLGEYGNLMALSARTGSILVAERTVSEYDPADATMVVPARAELVDGDWFRICNGEAPDQYVDAEFQLTAGHVPTAGRTVVDLTDPERASSAEVNYAIVTTLTAAAPRLVFGPSGGPPGGNTFQAITFDGQAMTGTASATTVNQNHVATPQFALSAFVGGGDPLGLLYSLATRISDAFAVAGVLSVPGATPGGAGSVHNVVDLAAPSGRSLVVRALNQPADSDGDGPAVGLRGGDAAGPGDHAGGDVEIVPGAGSGSGTDGRLVLFDQRVSREQILALLDLLGNQGALRVATVLFAYADFQGVGVANVNTKVLADVLPESAIVMGGQLHTVDPFVGPGLVTALLTGGTAPGATYDADIAKTVNGMDPISGANVGESALNYASRGLSARLTTTGCEINDLTAGSARLTVYYRIGD